MSLRRFQNLVRKIVRMIYTDPLQHLIIDFIVKHSIAESYTFALLHQMEGKNKQVQAALT